MNNLNFYTVDLAYVEFLRNAEDMNRGFSHVPNIHLGKNGKIKHFCGVVLQIAAHDYFVPLSSNTNQRPDSFLIKVSSGKVVNSLRFNYMFPVPIGLVKGIVIHTEPDPLYRRLLSQELRFCITNQDKIRNFAERTYKRVLTGKDRGLVTNSCDFKLLENKCLEYIQEHHLARDCAPVEN